MIAMRRTVAVLWMLAACGPWQDVTFEDEGDLCFARDGTDLLVNVHSPGCFSGSCTRETSGSCVAELVDGTIVVTSTFSWEERTRGDCTADCNRLVVDCVVEDLPDGAYPVAHGEAVELVTLPLESACEQI
jgi:hypothetical protein